MKRLTIAVDCDDVLVPSTGHIVDLYNQKYGTKVEKAHAHDGDNPEWQADKQTIGDRIHEIQLTEEYAATPPFNDAIEACKRLSVRHDLHMVTARPMKIIEVTNSMINEYFPDVFGKLEHIGLGASKGDYCRVLQADILIDDNLKHLVDARECGVSHLVLFGNYFWSEKDNIPDYVVQCDNWTEVEQEIERIARG